MQRFLHKRRAAGTSDIWLEQKGLLHPNVRAAVHDLTHSDYVFSADVTEVIRNDDTAWTKDQTFPELYKRIRVAYIAAAGGDLQNFKGDAQTTYVK